MLDYLLEPFYLEFMQKAFVIAFFIGGVCALFSCFLVLKGWSLMGDAISHGVLPGVALGHLLGFPDIGAFISGLSCALLTGRIQESVKIKDDAVMGIVFSGMFALGLLMISQIETNIHLTHILFGNILGVSWADFLTSSTLAILVSFILLMKKRDFMLFCFDPLQSHAMGFSLKRTRYALLALLSLTIVSALKTVGIILVIAMLIAPGAIGFLLGRTFDRMLAIAFLSSLLSCFMGVLGSYYLDLSTSASIVFIQGLFFSAAFISYHLKSS